MRSISRVADLSINTVTKLLVDAGKACLDLHDDTVRNVKASRIQCDEIWSFCHAKEKNVASAKAAPEGAGDVWTWTAIDADTKLIVSYFVGDRSGQSAMVLMDDLRARVAAEQAVADKLLLTQPALSKSLRQIEDEPGVRRFDRTPPGVVPPAKQRWCEEFGALFCAQGLEPPQPWATSNSASYLKALLRRVGYLSFPPRQTIGDPAEEGLVAITVDVPAMRPGIMLTTRDRATVWPLSLDHRHVADIC